MTDRTRREFLRGTATLGAGLVLGTAAGCSPEPPPGTGPFRYGVASGDPDETSVVLWTHHLPVAGSYAPVPVTWEVAADPSFATIVASGQAAASAARDWTVKVIATGLAAGATYHYRFRAAHGVSPVGRTRTCPDGAVSLVRLGVVSCSNYAFGRFHAYRHLADRDDLDAVVHLGDYIYEHATAGFVGNVYGTARPLDPMWEIVSLDDYRRRYAWYRRDPDLQELHRRHPMICMWDDHEFANDPVLWGASNHQELLEGDWSHRVAHAVRAHAEWLPTRVEGNVAYRSIRFGDLATLALVDRQRRHLFPEPGDGDLYLGRRQAEWLDESIGSSSAQWMVLGSPSTFGATDPTMTVGGWGVRDRNRVLDAVSASSVGNLVVAVGDIHKFRAMDVPRDPAAYDAVSGAGSAAVEFAAGSVTSPGSGDGGPGAQVKYHNGRDRGSAVLELTPDAMRVDFGGFADALKESPALPSERWLTGFASEDGSHRFRPVTRP